MCSYPSHFDEIIKFSNMLTIETLARHRKKHFFMVVIMEKISIKNIFAKYFKKYLEILSLRKFFLGDFTMGTPIVTAWWYDGLWSAISVIKFATILVGCASVRVNF